MKKLDRFEEVAAVALGLLALAGVVSGCGAIEAEMEDTSPVDSGGGGGGGRVGGRENDTVAPVPVVLGCRDLAAVAGKHLPQISRFEQPSTGGAENAAPFRWFSGEELEAHAGFDLP